MKKILLLVAIVTGLVLGGCSSGEDTENVKEEPKVEVKENAKETTENAGEKEKELPEVEPKKELPPELYLDIMKKNFAGTAEVTYNEEMKSFDILPTDPAFAQELAMILSGQMSIDEWNLLVDSMAETSEQLGADYVITMKNPVNSDNYILMVGNGVIIYDALNE
ncbi:hypothetical protein [Bacillus phage PK2]|nr:hypothetical protein [Bacillus phage PK2]